MMILDITTGRLQWVNAGHPAPLLIRDRAVLDRLEGPTTLPVGFGGQEPVVSERMLQPGDRLLCFTDGLIEEHHRRGSVRRGAAHRVDQPDPPRPHRGTGGGTSALHALKQERGGTTTDDATILLIEWRGGDADHLAALDWPATMHRLPR